MEPFATVDAWERLKSFVVDGDPAVAHLIEDRREADWGVLSTSEAQVLAIMAALGMDQLSPSDRRRARHLLGSLAAEAEGELLVAEEEDGLLVQPREVDRLRRTLRWIAENPPARFLNAISGPQAAVREVQRGAPSLGGLSAYRWLVALGYPCAVPETGRRQWLERFGLMEHTARGHSPTEVQQRTLTVLAELAQAVHAPLSEVDVVLEAFTAKAPHKNSVVALCGPKPRCEACPLRNDCSYFARHPIEPESPSRHLSKVMREEVMPRERLAAKGAGALTEEELIAILLRTGGEGLNAVDVATQVMSHAKSLERLASMSVEELAKMKGVGRVKAITIIAALELARRLRSIQSQPQPEPRKPINHSRQIFEAVEGYYVGTKREEFLVLLLDVRMRLIRIAPISVGTLSQSLVHPREAFADALRDSAHAVAFVHNHPTGDPTPSQQDEMITRRLVQAGEVVGIRVLDHVIVGRGRYYSFLDKGKL